MSSGSSFSDLGDLSDLLEVQGPDAGAGPDPEAQAVDELAAVLRHQGPTLLSLLGGYMSERTREWMRVRSVSLKALLGRHHEFVVEGTRGQHMARLAPLVDAVQALPSIAAVAAGSWGAVAADVPDEGPAVTEWTPVAPAATDWSPNWQEWHDSWARPEWTRPATTLRIRGLPFHATPEDVWVLLADVGADQFVTDLTVLHRRNGRPTGQALVAVDSVGAERVWRLHLKTVCDRYLEVLDA